MIEGARSGVGRIPRAEWDIRAELLDRNGDIATVRVLSAYLIDVCQVAKLDDRSVSQVRSRRLGA